MEKWKQRWEDNQLRWHKNEVDPFLIRYLSQLRENDKEDSQTIPKRFFVPLCGKTLDIAFILSLGYHVFAVEGVRQAIETLNRENGFDLEFNEKDSTFKSSDGKLQIYFGDLFTCPIENWAPFDYVWDKGSLTAIDEQCRPVYKSVMRKSVQIHGTDQYNDFKYLLRTVNYDKSSWDGKGPKCVSESDMEEMYGEWTTITLLQSSLLPESHVLRRNLKVVVGLVCHENIYLLTPKCN